MTKLLCTRFRAPAEVRTIVAGWEISVQYCLPSKAIVEHTSVDCVVTAFDVDHYNWLQVQVSHLGLVLCCGVAQRMLQLQHLLTAKVRQSNAALFRCIALSGAVAVGLGAYGAHGELQPCST